MSRGPGAVQRHLLVAVARDHECFPPPSPYVGAECWLPVADLAADLVARRPTRSELETVRRAARVLAAAGRINYRPVYRDGRARPTVHGLSVVDVANGSVRQRLGLLEASAGRFTEGISKCP